MRKPICTLLAKLASFGFASLIVTLFFVCFPTHAAHRAESIISSCAQLKSGGSHRYFWRLCQKLRKTISGSAFIILFGICLLPSKSEAITITVNSTGDAANPTICSTPGSPGCTLRGALILAADVDGTDIINFNVPANDPFCTSGVCTINAGSQLPAIQTAVVIRGPGADVLTIKNATGVSGSVIRVEAPAGSTISLSDLTISGGNATSGGGIVASTVIGVNISISDCVISGNSASQGGAIFNKATMLVRDSLITGNTGGAILNVGGDLKVVNSTIAANGGTGIENNNSGIAGLTNTTVSGNGGVASGGGITNNGNTFTVKSSIIARNGASFLSDINGPFVSAGFNLVGKRDAGMGFTAATDMTGTIASPLDPKLETGGLRNNGGTTKTITLLAGSPALDKGSATSLIGALSTDQRGCHRVFDDPAIPNAFGGDGTDIGALERRRSPFDFDGDGRTDISIFRPPPGEWWYLRSSAGGNSALQFGGSTDKITPADFTGDGKADITFWRSSTGNWFVLRSENSSFFAFPFGTAGDIPVPADYDGDGHADAGVFRPSIATWFISQSNGGGTRIFQFGLPGDKPVVADYDNDGRADAGIVRLNGGVMEWWINRSSAGLMALEFGAATDKAVQGDYTGDGKADVAIWRPSTGQWFIVRSENQTFFGFPFGTGGDMVAPGDYDGDGKFDVTVFRPSNGSWFVSRTAAGTQILQFGMTGDQTVPSAFVP